MAQKRTRKSVEGLDKEIEDLRALIQQASDQQTSKLALKELNHLLDSIGKNSLNLAHILKIRSELQNEEANTAAILREALLELEEEWPEFKKACAKFPLSREDA